MSDNIYLRNISKADTSSIFDWENNPENWEVSNTKKQFSIQEIEEFVNETQDINLNKQLRFIICKNESNLPIGCIDLFEYEFGKSVGVGVLIADNVYRNKGYATEALKLVVDYCRNELNVAHIFCNIFINNKPSIRLFERCGFKFVEERFLDQQKVNYFELRMA